MLARHVGQNHHGKLQALGGVDRHQPHAVRAFFEHRRFMGFRFFGLRLQLFDESAERNSARQLESTREVATRYTFAST